MYLHHGILNSGDGEPRAVQPQRLADRKPGRKPRPVTIGRATRHQDGFANRQVPTYLREVYSWAYLTPSLAKVLDRQSVVEAILWGNARRLVARVVSEIEPGWRVLQPAAVYGNLSRELLAAALGPNGSLMVSDVAPLQVQLLAASSLTFRRCARIFAMPPSPLAVHTMRWLASFSFMKCPRT